MDSSTEIPLVNQKRLIEELTQAQELVKRLKIIVDKPIRDDKYLMANDLLVQISSSFMGSIAMMHHSHKDYVSTTALVNVPEFYDRKEDSRESSKTSNSKDGRGFYKRRKKFHTPIQISPNLTDDGHVWRKYGQKRIQNSEQPRNYFRCTHKFDQDCQATKQVQKTEDDPPMYQITYYGKHTCKNPLLNNTRLIFNTTDFNASQLLISFDSSKKNHKSAIFWNFHSIKEEYNPIVDSNRNLSPDVMTMEPSGPVSVFSSGSDYGDILSNFSATSAPSYEFEQMNGLHGFSDDLEFELEQYFS